MISDINLAFWIKNQYNVIFRGKHGVGKTATILEAFNKHNLKYQYFSASTMDPWVDFIGVPKEKIDEKGNSYLDLVRPKHFQNDEVEAIFLDEFNRSSKKVRNAVMELIQFKSINGKKFNNLKLIWAAINPEDDEEEKYDVEALDAAQLDRFHIVVDIPYTPHVPYFRNKYGATTADAAITWWKDLGKDQKNMVSPRRLDYAIDIYTKNGDLKHVLYGKGINTAKLALELETGSISGKLKEIAERGDSAAAKDFLSIENHYAACANYIMRSKNYFDFFLPLLPEEKLITMMEQERAVENNVFSNYDKYEEIIKNLASSSSGKLAGPADKLVKQYSSDRIRTTSDGRQINLDARYKYIKNANLDSFKTELEKEQLRKKDTSQDRERAYDFLHGNLPKVLDEEAATGAMEMLVEILMSSKKTTVQDSFRNIIPMLNHTCNFFISKNRDIPLDPKVIDRITDEFSSFVIRKKKVFDPKNPIVPGDDGDSKPNKFGIVPKMKSVVANLMELKNPENDG